MKNHNRKVFALCCSLCLLFFVIAGLSVSAFAIPQGSGDYLNEQEVDRIREAQEIELRTQVFLFIANRRLKVMTGELKQQTKKEEENWGPLPQGSKTELLDGYRRAISELMEKVDDTYEHNPKAEGLKKALKRIADATDLHMKLLDSLRATIREEDTARALAGAIEVTKTANEGAKAAMKQGGVVFSSEN